MTTRVKIQQHTIAEGEARLGNVSFEFGSVELAAEFLAHCLVARRDTTNPRRMYLESPPGLELLRLAASKRPTHVFRFSKFRAAAAWWMQTLIGDLDPDFLEVRFESDWETCALDRKLRSVKEEASKRSRQLEEIGRAKGSNHPRQLLDPSNDIDRKHSMIRALILLLYLIVQIGAVMAILLGPEFAESNAPWNKDDKRNWTLMQKGYTTGSDEETSSQEWS